MASDQNSSRSVPTEESLDTRDRSEFYENGEIADSSITITPAAVNNSTSNVLHRRNESETGSDAGSLDDDFLEFRLSTDDPSIMRARSEGDGPDSTPEIVRYSSSGIQVLPTLDSISHRKSPPKQLTSPSVSTPSVQDNSSNNPPPVSTSHNSASMEYKEGATMSRVVSAKSDTESEEGWQDMKTVGSYEIYDDKGRLVVHKSPDLDSGSDIKKELDKDVGENFNGSKGYTRVAVDEDTQSINSMDDNVDFLFQDEDENLDRSPLSQLQSTKKMLTDSQRIAYVGLCRLVMTDMCVDLSKLSGSRKISKKLSTAQGSTNMWSQKMMMRLYHHMEITSEEQVMIEQLFVHGVLPSDLTPTLTKSAKIKNPIAHTNDGDIVVSSDKEGTNLEAKDLNIENPGDYKDQDFIDIDVKWTVLCDLFLVLVSDSVYDSRSRTLLERVAHELGISALDIAQFERKVTDSLELEEGNVQEWDESELLENRRKMALKKKYMYMGLATLGGGLVIGLSAGLLAPVIGAGLAAGFTTVGVAGTGTFLAGAGGAAVVTSTGAAVGATIGNRGMSKRMGHVKTFEFRPLHNHRRVNAIVTVSGWMLGKEDDVRLPFSTIDPVMGDLFSLLWEPEMLQSMGQTINILATEVLTQSIQQVLGSTILVALMAAIQLPVVLTKLSYLLDNPWNVSLDRAWSAGLILADTLINRNLGVRPVTLVGYSLGARVIYSCLVELARRGAYGLVQDVFIFGDPVVIKRDQFVVARGVVSGRFVNGYSTKDWILGYLFRATSGGLGRVAGLGPIEFSGCNVENFDTTDLVDGHMGYRKAMPKLLASVGWEVISEDFTEIEDPDPDKMREKQRELIVEFEEARKQMEKEAKEAEEAAKESNSKTKKGKSKLFSWMKPKKKEWWDFANREAQAEIQKNQEREDGSQEDNEGSREDNVMFDLAAIQQEVQHIAKEVERQGNAQEPIFSTPIKKAVEPELEPEPEYEHEHEPDPEPSFDDHLKETSAVQMSFDDFDAFTDDEADRNGR